MSGCKGWSFADENIVPKFSLPTDPLLEALQDFISFTAGPGFCKGGVVLEGKK